MHSACRQVALTLVLAACSLIAARTVCASEVTDLEARLESLEKQIDQEKDKTRKEELKKQEKQAETDLKAARKRAKAAAKAKGEPEAHAVETADAGKKKATGLNKFARFWTEDVGKPMRKFFHRD